MTDTEFFKGFRFNLFQFKQLHFTDQMNEEGCPCHFFARLVQGTAKISTGTHTLHLQAGDLFYIPKGLRYRSYWYPAEGTVAFYSFGFPLFPTAIDAPYALQKILGSPAALALFGQLEQSLTVEAASIGCLYRFLGEVSPAMAVQSTARTAALIGRALEYMRQTDSYRIADIAAYCGISEPGLYLKFRTHLHKTPVQVRHEILAEKAAELLRTTDLTVEEISSRLQCSSASYFRKIFYSQTGKTPTQYRKEAQHI